MAHGDRMDTTVHTLLETSGGLLLAETAHDHGLTPRDLRRLTAPDGELVPVVRGAYSRTDTWARSTASERLALRTRAVIARLREPVTASHVSAAAVLGLPLLSTPGTRVHVARCRLGSGRRCAEHTIHRWYGPGSSDQRSHPEGPRDLTSAEQGGHDKVPAVRPVLAAFGVGEIDGFQAGVVALDAALRADERAQFEVEEWLARLTHRPTFPLLRRMAHAADGRSESPFETVARIVCRELGFVVVPQYGVRTSNGDFVARTDLWLPELGVLGEIDGLVKYVRPDGTGSPEAVLREKHRESALRDLGYGVARFETGVLSYPDRVLAILRQAASQSRRAMRGTP